MDMNKLKRAIEDELVGFDRRFDSTSDLVDHIMELIEESTKEKTNVERPDHQG